MQHTEAQHNAKTHGGDSAQRSQWLGELETTADSFLATLATLDTLSQRQGPLLDRAERDLAADGGDTTTIPNSDAVVALVDVLAEREQMLETLAPQTAALQSLRERFERERGLVAEPDRMRVQRKLDGIKTVADAIAVRDRADESRLEALRAAVVKEITDLQRSRKAVVGYSNPASASAPIAKFHDAEG
jgi:hypothetical protein